MTSKLQRIVWATLIIATLPVANAAERVDVDRVVTCANERDDARRLACYDDAVAAAKPKRDFGVTGSAVARQRQEEQQQQNESSKVTSITAQVTAVSSKPHGELVITLDNGQVWAQKKRNAISPLNLAIQPRSMPACWVRTT